MILSYVEQSALLSSAAARGLTVGEAITREGLRVNDLRYSDYDAGQAAVASPLPWRPEWPQPAEGPVIPAVSFFAGAGGLEVGFQHAGFRNILSFEHTALFCQTLRANDDHLVIGPPNSSGDVSDRAATSKALQDFGIRAPFNGVFHGGPPCQSAAHIAVAIRSAILGDYLAAGVG